MQHDSRAYLHDVITAAENIRNFVQARSFEEYRDDIVIRSAVERQFEIVGEALARISRCDPELAARIPNLRDIVDFRNIIAHGYDVVDDEIVWDIIENHLPALIRNCRAILDG